MNFLKYRYLFLTISLIIIISGITYGFLTGFRFDIDFKGGTKIQVDLKTEFNNNEIENLISNITGSKPLVQKMSSGKSSVSITTDVIPEETSEKITDALKEKYTTMDDPSIRNVQPAFGKNLIQSAILALVVSILALLVYIGIRFKTLGFISAITAIMSLLHDILIMVALYGIFKLPINSTFVAVLLTIIGYSINDTIIVYDRIRENRRKITKSTDLKDTINTSISQTMRRTMFTSFTTIGAISIVLIFAYLNNQQVLIEFSLPLVVGILTGTYSSIFVASSLWYIFDKMKFKSAKNKI
ncbi:MAG: protein translocase subunit SecF [Clostridia bacterium]|nr:protein translocase subunit SecF [Clostridia bacterium]MDD4386238.1 protein translocase subunit SecF [Clostridia bacterium]